MWGGDDVQEGGGPDWRQDFAKFFNFGQGLGLFGIFLVKIQNQKNGKLQLECLRDRCVENGEWRNVAFD